MNVPKKVHAPTKAVTAFLLFSFGVLI
jgi:hypothetical protein